MPDYRFVGAYPTFYGDPLNRQFAPGDILTADSPPNDGQWVEVTPDDITPETAEPDQPVTSTRTKRSS